MTLEVDGKIIETTPMGFLTDIGDWNERIAEVIADSEEIELTERHWDVVKYLRDEYINNAGNQPNTRSMVKAMAKKWNDRKVKAKTLYDLFPGDPSKQGGRIGGLPESRRKGGY